jgi:hypothetical protein
VAGRCTSWAVVANSGCACVCFTLSTAVGVAFGVDANGEVVQRYRQGAGVVHDCHTVCNQDYVCASCMLHEGVVVACPCGLGLCIRDAHHSRVGVCRTGSGPTACCPLLSLHAMVYARVR